MLGVAQLSAIELEPADFVRAAATAGLRSVSLFVNQASAHSVFPLVTRENLTEVKAALNDEDVTVLNAECFMLTPASIIENYRPAIELGAELGAQNIVALLYDEDEVRTIDNLTTLCARASELELGVGIEFMPFAPKWKTLADTLRLIESLALPNLKVAIDCLHLFRSGGRVADLAGIPNTQISHVQLCDSQNLEVTSDYFHEAGVERLGLGDGVFPLFELLQALPDDVALELEVPQAATTPAQDRLTAMVSGARYLLHAAGRS